MNGCNSCAQSNLSHPFAGKAVREAATMNARARDRGYNCTEPGRVLFFSSVFDILATATGASFATQATSGLDAARTAGDFIRLQPYGQDKLRLHGILFDGATGAAVTALVGVGQVFLSGKEVRPTMQASYADHLVPGVVLDCDRYYKCGVDAMNTGCLPSFNEDNPMDIALVNFAAGTDDDDITITVALEYI